MDEEENLDYTEEALEEDLLEEDVPVEGVVEEEVDPDKEGFQGFDLPDRICPFTNCGKTLKARSLLGHLGKIHKCNVVGFMKRFPDEEPPLTQLTRGLNQFTKYTKPKADTAEGRITETFTKAETTYFDGFVKDMFQQMDKDATQLPRLQALAFDHIVLMRYQRKLADVSNKANSFVNKELNSTIKDIESRIDEKMRRLTLDRESKVKNRSQVKSTPGSIISAYIDEIDRQTVEILEVMLLEEEQALASVQKILDDHYFPRVDDIVQATEADYEDGNRYSLDIESVIRRSGVEF